MQLLNVLFAVLTSVVPICCVLTEQYEKELSEVKLYYYSPRNSHEIDIDSEQPLEHFGNGRQVKVLIHGWNADRDQIATMPVRTAYQLQDRHELLVADWANASTLLYPVARRLVLPVAYRAGAILARFLHRTGIEHARVHIVGHSLGAHIAGNMGKYFGGRLGRITGLDPAGPLFHQNSPDAISRDDAQFVDAIHTDGFILGEVVARAHVDFYPNRGISAQPGCETLDLVTLHACSHYRSTAYFAESILLPYNFIAHECGLEEIFDSTDACQPRMGRTAVAMGEHLHPSTRGTYYLRTPRIAPYGLGNLTSNELVV